MRNLSRSRRRSCKCCACQLTDDRYAPKAADRQISTPFLVHEASGSINYYTEELIALRMPSIHDRRLGGIRRAAPKQGGGGEMTPEEMLIKARTRRIFLYRALRVIIWLKLGHNQAYLLHNAILYLTIFILQCSIR